MDITPTVATLYDIYYAIHRMATKTAVVQTGTAEKAESTALCEANGQIHHLQIHRHLFLLNLTDYQHFDSL